MPHLTLEYSHNLTVDTNLLFEDLHERLTASGAIALKGLKSRAIRHEQWRVADGDERYSFVHLTLLLREGRSDETKEDLAAAAMQSLREAFGHLFESGYISLSVDVKEMLDRQAHTEHNIPAGGVKDQHERTS